MAEVEIGHLLIAMAGPPQLAAAMARCGLDPVVLTTVIEATFMPDGADRQRATPRTSTDLRTLLDIAQNAARVAGVSYVTTHTMLSVLLALPSALRAVHDVSRWFWAARLYPGASRTQPAPQIPPPHPQQEIGQPPAPPADFSWLEARLDRQEQMLSVLRTHMETPAARVEPPAAVVTPAAAPTKSAQQRIAMNSVPPQTKADLPAEDVPDDDDLDDEEAQATGIKRYYLCMDDEIVRAPSIGPATAARLQPHGITHVKHLLACEPERLSARIGARHLTTSRIAAWKNQARLVCSIPWLRGTHAQLLVGAGYGTIEKILSAERTVVCAAIMQYATTRDGQSILRNGQPPEMERIMRWIENSQQAEPQRAEPSRTQAVRGLN